MDRKTQNFFGALNILLKKLKEIDFALVGTFNISIQGVKVTPRDLDILTDDKGIKKIAQIFSSTITTEREDHYKETQFRIGNIEIHVVSNVNNPLRPTNFKKHIVWIKKENLKIPCMSLKSELSFYRQSGRDKDQKKVELIRKLKSARIT